VADPDKQKTDDHEVLDAETSAPDVADLGSDDPVALEEPTDAAEGVAEDTSEVADALPEDAETAATEPVQQATEHRPAAAEAAPQRRSGGMAGVLTGGVLAAILGFGLAQVVPAGWPFGQSADLTAALTEKLAAQDTRLADLSQQIAAIEARPAEAPGDMTDTTAAIAASRAEIDASIAGVEAAGAARAAALDGRLAALEARLSDLEERPVVTAGGEVDATALASLEEQLKALRDEVDAQIATSGGIAAELEAMATDARARADAAEQQAATLRADAEAAAQAAIGRAALSRVQAAVEAGGPYASALADLRDTGAEIPAVLDAEAKDGVPTLADLQHGFPVAARAALDASIRATMGDGWLDRLTALFRTQTGVRSLEPRSGNDPDAVLSRAEAALGDGRIADAIAELAALPPAGQAEMADWQATAQRRIVAIDAVAALAASLNGN
jgi:hypothetical protein